MPRAHVRWSRHATPRRSSRSSISPSELEQRLLSAYAVELLPVERLHEAGYRPGSPAPAIGCVATARAELRELVTGLAGVLAIAMMVVAVWGLWALGLFGLEGAEDVPSEPAIETVVVAGPFADDVDPRPPLALRHPILEPSDVFSFGVVCGHRIGSRVDLKACGRPRAEIIGFYRSPPEPRRACVPAGHAYTRKRSFSVCWFDPEDGVGPGLELVRLPRVHLLDLS
ncbi:MAG: hypothetical protein L0206_13315 [Actinobacteria bacterium]|nr:hypothetical protein [Actinomycetota bacterium]